MTYKSPKQRITEVYHPVAKFVKTVAKGVKAVVSDPLGNKRQKKMMEIFDRDQADKKKEILEGRKKEYYKVK